MIVFYVPAWDNNPYGFLPNGMLSFKQGWSEFSAECKLLKFEMYSGSKKESKQKRDQD